jgi:phosphoglycolate phosphatase-like HAD superfamily hydrolase
VTSRPTVLLFDIDGTLMTQKGVSRRAAAEAFGEVFGDATALDAVHFAGRTDPLIFGDGLRIIGREVTAEALEAVFVAYLRILPDRMRTDPHVALLPGIHDLLAALRPHAHLAIGLGTGNIERGARLKLEHFDLWTAFDFGGFGSDHHDRAALIGIGAARGAARLGRPLSECRVVVIGDTPLDVAAARANGAETLGVLTGGDTRETLERAGAEAVVDDLTDAAALRWLLGA